MNTNKKPLSGEKSNGANDLINELKSICGIYAEDIRMIKSGIDGVDGKNLVLLGKTNGEATFQKVMALFDKVAKIKELAKETEKKPIEEEPLSIDSAVEETGNKIKSIQDFALNKKKIG